jgi:hypothetical protein
MFTLELDLILHYCPPMDEHGGGIHLTRSVELPFAPVCGQLIAGRRLDP